MKKGLMVYKAKGTLKNIGDYIQSVAAAQYTGHDVVYVEREHMHEYAGEPIKMILNGWFMHKPENWPPSENIIPLLTSFHINPAIAERMLTEQAIQYFKKHGPVGCRDKGTERLLKAKGIDAYLSGCLTLTLGNSFKHNPKNESICFVDPYYKVPKTPMDLIQYLLLLVSKPKTILRLATKLNGAFSIRNLLKALSFYRTYSKVFEEHVLVNAEYINHSVLESSFISEESKLAYARNLLERYASCQLVVTSRIHAALPCIGMDTPVVFVVSDDLKPDGEGIQPNAKGRFEGLIELFNVMEYANFQLKPIHGFTLPSKIGFNHTIRNKQQHIKMAGELHKQCTAFVANVTKASGVV